MVMGRAYACGIRFARHVSRHVPTWGARLLACGQYAARPWAPAVPTATHITPLRGAYGCAIIPWVTLRSPTAMFVRPYGAQPQAPFLGADNVTPHGCERLELKKGQICLFVFVNYCFYNRLPLPWNGGGHAEFISTLVKYSLNFLGAVLSA